MNMRNQQSKPEPHRHVAPHFAPLLSSTDRWVWGPTPRWRSSGRGATGSAGSSPSSASPSLSSGAGATPRDIRVRHLCCRPDTPSEISSHFPLPWFQSRCGRIFGRVFEPRVVGPGGWGRRPDPGPRHLRPAAARLAPGRGGVRAATPQGGDGAGLHGPLRVYRGLNFNPFLHPNHTGSKILSPPSVSALGYMSLLRRRR